MDAVYICRAGDNEELRYSLRSLVNVEHDHVWLFGGAPGWFAGRHVLVAQDEGKYGNARRAIEAACLDPRVSDPFILMNDDFFAVAPAPVALRDRGPLSDVIEEQAEFRPRGQYLRGMRKTLEFLEARGYTDPLCFGLHMPMPVRKATMLGVLSLIAGYPPGLHLRTIYGVMSGEPSRTIEDVKLCGLRESIPPGPWISTNDSTFETVLPMLERLFPEPSRYEEETVRARVIKRFRDREAGVSRRVGDEFDVTPERLAQINSTRHGQLVEVVEDEADIPEVASADEMQQTAEVPRTVKDIKAILDARGIEYRGVTKKADLLALL